MPDALGKRFVRSVLAEKTIAPATAMGVGEAELFDDAAKALRWSLDRLAATGDWPLPYHIEESLGISLPDEPDSLAYVADLVRKRALARGLKSAMERAIECIDDRSPDDAFDALRGSLGGLRGVSGKPEVRSFRGTGLERLEAYRAVTESGGFSGLRTPWLVLNELVQGWVDGTLNVVTAMQNTGKTWFCCVVADHAMRASKRVLFVSLEMAAMRVERRIDCVHYELPFGDVRDAKLESGLESVWEDGLRSAKDVDGDILVADKRMVQRVSDVVSLVHEYRPDLVVIDGGYRFSPRVDAKQTSMWASTVEIVTDLQLAAEMTDVPWIVSTQQGDASETGKEKKRGPHMRAWNVRYGKEWVINPDVVLGLYADETLRSMRQLEVHVLKMRDAVGGGTRDKFHIAWDTHSMSFHEIIEDVGEASADHDHEVGFSD